MTLEALICFADLFSLSLPLLFKTNFLLQSFITTDERFNRMEVGRIAKTIVLVYFIPTIPISSLLF